MTARQILVTAALPYANGPIHLGHLVEYIQTDIWVRFQKLRGNNCIFICADDTHGTAIMIRARQEGRSEEALIADMREQHLRDFTGFHIDFANYGSTHSSENRRLCGEFWKSLRAADMVREREVTQLYDPAAKTFLADRFVKGTCPKCKSPNQYGDTCDNCGSTYSPSDLIDPVSTLSGAKPELRSAPHLFIELEKLHAFLSQWSQTGDEHSPLQSEVANYLKGHFLNEPLHDWDISRPVPYFGFEIADSPGNYWYVWFDAPIGYMASLTEWCQKNGQKFETWWPRNGNSQIGSPFSRDAQRSDDAPASEIHHFIGKDITYFHTLFWPGMLQIAGFQLPTKVHIHGFLTVGGEKMSKSKGTFIQASTYLKHLNPAYLRYYYASKLSSRVDDLDLNPDEFVMKVNSDLVGKVVNLASRTARFVEETGLSNNYVPYSEKDSGPESLEVRTGWSYFNSARDYGDIIADAYERCDFGSAMRETMFLADQANVFVDKKAPWALRKDPVRAKELQDICTVALNLFRQLAIYLAPVLPELAKQAGELLNDPITHWDQAKTPLVGTRVNKFKPMLTRVEPAQVQAMIEESKPTESTTSASPGVAAGANPSSLAAQTSSVSNNGPEALAAEPLAAECTIDDFTKIDLRVARILTAEEVPDARKLLKLTLSLGGDVRKTVFAGIKKAYPQPEKLVGRLVICVANLQPRQMKFGLSEGMVTAAGGGGDEVFLLSPDSGAKPGHRVH
ncbi:MAG TPA: methionine--tRNA ligase [Pirellulales bacterium]|jgi:methionyl-tRNA synthetase|nr:methionine--tRNA ligase [Pirellulales bacterium]